MYSFKKSLPALVGLLVLVAALAALLPLSGRGQGNSPNVVPQLAPRQFYLTQTEHVGNQALSACAAGYHMASLWEIHDPTYLRYNATLGYTKADTGSGPPAGAGAHGWIRTGGSDHNGPFPGSGNCLAWTSTAGHGTVVSLSDIWDNPTLSKIDPWTPNVRVLRFYEPSCDLLLTLHVYAVFNGFDCVWHTCRNVDFIQQFLKEVL